MELSILLSLMRRLPIFLACMAAMACIPPAAAQPAVSAGRYHNLGLAADGSVFWWGDEPGMRVMLGERLPARAPQRVEGLPPAIAVAAGWAHSSAVARDGSVYEWGFSPYRVRQVELVPILHPCVAAAVLSGGHGDDPCHEVRRERASRMRLVKPMRIPGLPPALAIAAADSYSAIVSRGGEVHCWGLSAFPKKVAGLERIKAIALGQFHGVALREDGVVFGWGGGSGGGIAYEARDSSDLCGKPDPRPFFSGAIAIAASADATYALRADGSVWAWGRPWKDAQSLPKEPNPDGKADAFVGRRVATLEGASALGGGRDPSALTRQGRAVRWQYDYQPGAAPRLLGAVGNIAAVSSYSSILALRADGFVCTMGSNMGGVTLPGDASPEIDRFVPVPLGNGRGLLNLADARHPAPADVCATTSP